MWSEITANWRCVQRIFHANNKENIRRHVHGPLFAFCNIYDPRWTLKCLPYFMITGTTWKYFWMGISRNAYIPILDPRVITYFQFEKYHYGQFIAKRRGYCVCIYTYMHIHLNLNQNTVMDTNIMTCTVPTAYVKMWLIDKHLDQCLYISLWIYGLPFSALL